MARAIQGLLDPAGGRRGAFGWRSATQRGGLDGRSPRLRELGRFVGRPPGARESQATAVAAPAVVAPAVTAAPQATPQASAPAAKPIPPPGPTTADGDEVVSSVAARAPR